MSIFFAHLNIAAKLIADYKNEQPLHIFLKSFFTKNKKYGSKDRKNISNLIYNYYRIGHNLDIFDTETALLAATYIIEPDTPKIIQTLKPDWPVDILDIDKKAEIVGLKQLDICNTAIIKFLSESVNFEKYKNAIYTQPKVFLRLRPQAERRVKDKLDDADVTFELINNRCLSVKNNINIDTIIELDREAQIQDLSSQNIGFSIAEKILDQQKTNPYIWDCCAASGGKSMLLFDSLPAFQLTVSDNRPSILLNLKNRFNAAGISQYKSSVLDLCLPANDLANESFDYIMADVPCTGSGTWARTPEYLYFFKENDAAKYQALQQSILKNIVPKLKQGGLLFYITCSVFKNENEANVVFVTEKLKLKLLSSQYQIGFENNADTMFWACFQKI